MPIHGLACSKTSHTPTRKCSTSRALSTHGPGVGTAAPVPTVTSLAAEAKAARGGTENQQEEAAKKVLVRWLTVFSKVHELHKVPELAAVFFNTETGRMRIAGEKTLETLIQNVAQCSERLHLHGSPAGFPVGPADDPEDAPQ